MSTPLTRDEIVQAAVEVLDRDSTSGLSMRALARHFEVTPMALYHHVGSRADLLVAVLDRVSQDLERPELPVDPRARAVAVALSLHRFVVARPWVAEVIATGRYASATGLWVPEQLIGAAVDAGLDDRSAFVFYRSIFHLTLGHALATVAAANDRSGPGALSVLDGDPADLPHMRRLAPDWEELSVAADVATLITGVVDGLLPPPPGTTHDSATTRQ